MRVVYRQAPSLCLWTVIRLTCASPGYLIFLPILSLSLANCGIMTGQPRGLAEILQVSAILRQKGAELGPDNYVNGIFGGIFSDSAVAFVLSNCQINRISGWGTLVFLILISKD
ncbi:hypothetical protein RM190_12475 [Paracoccus sp. CPCC 101403]|uniref:Uncharacterized protein n=1 Tax=Paracoccus broussonetiae TaxID=3075834 RepID=A0ABU3EEM2_9RHOB|nr:hypothetical protein [Paracoccus sp. CPCC 101403]MDT1062685.1 hypothetical protein [Paracoccus sp. CPCC 101403]